MNRLATVLALILAGPLFGAPPILNIPAEVAATGDYATVTPQTDAKSITYVALSGVEPFPSAFLKDPRAFVLPVRGLQAGRYRFVAVGTLNDEQSRQEFAVLVGQSPEPGPSPGPGPPTPGPSPAPTPARQLRALIVYESADLSTLPASQVAALQSKEVRDYLNAKCAKGPDGKTAEWRMWDQHVELSAAGEAWKLLMRKQRPSLPYLYLTDGPEIVFEGPVPATVEETLTLLKKHGG